MANNISVICNKNELKKIRSFVNQHLKDLPFSSKEKHEIVLAVDEACANAIIHGNACDEGKSIDVVLTHDNSTLSVTVSDVGDIDFVEKRVMKKDLERLARERKKGGMGLHLIFAIMDEVRFYTRNKRSYCTLIKNLPH